MSRQIKRNIVMEGAPLAFRNFSGKEGKYNPEGNRNFCVFLDDKIAKDLEADGWNVRYLAPREVDDLPQAYLQVKLEFVHFPPKIILMNSKGKTPLTDANVGILDWAEIANADLEIRPYNWSYNGKSGVKAYLKELFVTIAESELELKYRDVPDSGQDRIDDEAPF